MKVLESVNKILMTIFILCSCALHLFCVYAGNWQEEVDFSTLERDDDLSTLKNDLGVELDYLNEDFEQKYFKGKESKGDKSGNVTVKKGDYQNLKLKDGATSGSGSESGSAQGKVAVDEKEMAPGQYDVFEVGPEEKELLRVSKFLEHRIPEKEWNELAAKSKLDRYQIVEGDYLWKLSRRFFGTGFYYSKIWSLNPTITNPHEIEPGMVLVFDTGDSTMMPQIQVGEFTGGKGDKQMAKSGGELTSFGDDTVSPWFKERERLLKNGSFFQYASDSTYDDIKSLGDKVLNQEYERYAPPRSDLQADIPSDQYDELGISKDSKIRLKFKEGYALTTFVTSNIVQDLGEIDASRKETQFLHLTNKVYVRFNSDIKVIPGDFYSIYSAQGKVSYSGSERSGYKYTITGEIKVIRPVSDLWECEITRLTAPIQRADRITVHTPKIHKIIYTFNDRAVEAVVVGGYSSLQKNFSQGDIVYLDRGRADGLEVGNVFEFYGFKDQFTGKRITLDPTYKTGEAVVLTLTDNFATVLIHSSQDAIVLGSWAITKSKEQAALASKLRKKENNKMAGAIQQKALDNLDVELNVDNMNDQLLKKADKIDLTEDELAELERQEREKSFIQHSEKDLKELERLEEEITTAETQLNEQKQDEDKILEKQDVNEMEKKALSKAEDLFDTVNEVEKKVGRKYQDEDINSTDNPYGLTKYDLEEIDELLDKKDQTATDTNAGPRPEGNNPDTPKDEDLDSIPSESATPVATAPTAAETQFDMQDENPETLETASNEFPATQDVKQDVKQDTVQNAEEPALPPAEATGPVPTPTTEGEPATPATEGPPAPTSAPEIPPGS